MDSSDWIGLIYVVVAVGSFPIAVRICWRNEIELAQNTYRKGPDLGLAGFYAFALCLFWPLLGVYWILMGLLKILTIDIKEKE